MSVGATLRGADFLPRHHHSLDSPLKHGVVAEMTDPVDTLPMMEPYKILPVPTGLANTKAKAYSGASPIEISGLPGSFAKALSYSPLLAPIVLAFTKVFNPRSLMSMSNPVVTGCVLVYRASHGVAGPS